MKLVVGRKNINHTVIFFTAATSVTVGIFTMLSVYSNHVARELNCHLRFEMCYWLTTYEWCSMPTHTTYLHLNMPFY